LRTRQEGGKVLIEVGDTGAGMTAEEREKIFTPYYTSKAQGTGLGLAIVAICGERSWRHGPSAKARRDEGKKPGGTL